MKIYLSIVFMFISVGVVAQAPAKVNSKNKVSVFADFEQLGILKDSFISQYGMPVAKDMVCDSHADKIETLHYIEFLDKGKVIVNTKFIFVNKELIEQKSFLSPYPLEKEMLKKIQRDISFNNLIK